MSLVLLTEVNLAAPMCAHIHCGDSSTFGWSLMETSANLDEIRDAFRWKEKWHFIDVSGYHAAPPSLAPRSSDCSPLVPTPTRTGRTSTSSAWRRRQTSAPARPLEWCWRQRPTARHRAAELLDLQAFRADRGSSCRHPPALSTLGAEVRVPLHPSPEVGLALGVHRRQGDAREAHGDTMHGSTRRSTRSSPPWTR